DVHRQKAFQTLSILNGAHPSVLSLHRVDCVGPDHHRTTQRILHSLEKACTIEGSAEKKFGGKPGVEWYFRDISGDPSEKELTQQDQFNNDEVVLAEALVRETIQNSTDARLQDKGPVRVRFTLAEPTSPEERRFFSSLLTGLMPHLEACKIPLPA